MKKLATVILGVAVLGTAGVWAQQGNGNGAQHRRGAGPRGFPPPISELFDSNRDGALSAAEIEAAPAQIARLDQNNDGQITFDEACQGPGQGRHGGQGRGAAEQGKTPVLLRLLDANKDGVLTPEEAAGAAAALRAFDKDNDGIVTGDELRPAGNQGAGPGQGQGRGRGKAWGRS